MNNWSVRRIASHLKKSGSIVSKSTVSNIIQNRGKKRDSRLKGIPCKSSVGSRKVTKAMLDKLDRWTNCANPMTQKMMANKLGISQSYVSKLIREKLKKRQRIKLKVHHLTPENKQNRLTNARKLYNLMSRTSLEYFVTLDEAQVFLIKNNHKTRHCYLRRGQQLPDDCIIANKENFGKHFMVVGGMTGRGILPLIRIPLNVKISGDTYVKYVLKPYFEKFLPQLYPTEMHKVIFHHDKASSHTSKFAKLYLDQQKKKLKINYIPKENIPVKGADISPLDFFGFGFLKQKANACKATTLDGVWKFWRRTWSEVTPEMCTNVFQNWKLRLGHVYRRNGAHIEHVKQIHKRKLFR